MKFNRDLIEKKFEHARNQYADADIMNDGILDETKYSNARVKILWILKQDYYDSGAHESPYVTRLRQSISGGNVQKSPTWSRMSRVSYGLLSGNRDIGSFPDVNVCAGSLLETAVIEANKELGESNSPDQVVSDGYQRYKELINFQISSYKPDVIIVCLPENLRPILDSMHQMQHGVNFVPGSANVIIEGADVAIGNRHEPLFLWAYHPQARRGAYSKGIDDISYTASLLKAYDNAMREKGV